MNIALIIFNRPKFAEKVLERIAQAKPDILFVIGDGPRVSVVEDDALVRETRALVDRGDWARQVITNYSEANMGCAIRVQSGLSWVFEQVDRCIILEDDCLPDPSFFLFCEELLDRYADDRRVTHITGDSFLKDGWLGQGSYYGSVYPFIWGWATWRRAWQHMDLKLSEWPRLKSTSWLADYLQDFGAARYWSARFDYVVRSERLDTWDISWVFACWRMGGVAIHPNVNLVRNIGWGVESTHTKESVDVLQVETCEIKFPLRHPQTLHIERAVDNALFERIFAPRPRLWDKLQSRHTYGAVIRNMPVLGRWWARWRQRRAEKAQGGV